MTRAPGLLTDSPPVDLGVFPTPVVEEPALARAFGLRSLHVKRDDLSSPVYGGTKVRALEWLFGAAIKSGAEGIVTLGARGSHHVVATAIFARRLGLRARAVLFPQPESPDVLATARVLRATGTEVLAPRTWPGVLASWLSARKRPLGAGRPFVIPAGATSALGLLGAVEGALELAADIGRGDLPRPDVVIVPAGSCGTAAGLLLGIAVAGLGIPVAAVRVVPRVVARPAKVRRLARSALRLLRAAGLEAAPSLGPLTWISDQAGRGYARPTRAGQDAVRAVSELAAFRAESTYTGKALAHARSGRLSGCRVLFWNTFSAKDPPAEAPGA